MKNESLQKKLTGFTLLVIFSIMIFLVCPAQVRAAGKVQIKKTAIHLSKNVYTYNGKVQKPAVIVKYKGKKLRLNKNYTLIYAGGRKLPGVYTVTVKGKGTYQGSVKKTFRINPLGTKLVSIGIPTSGTELKLVWKKQTKASSGYQIQYCTRSNWKGYKIQTIRGVEKTTAILKNLKSQTRYYLRIRTFYRDKKGKTYYSAWSKITSRVTLKKDNSSVKQEETKKEEETKVPKEPLTFQYDDYKVIEEEVGGIVSIGLSNYIKKIEFSNPDVLSQRSKKLTNVCSFNALTPGKTKITFTDIYDQKITSSVTIIENIYANGVKNRIESTRYDASLPIPEISKVYANNNYVKVACPGTFYASDPYVGYEAWLSDSPGFSEILGMQTITVQVNKSGYGILPFFRYTSGAATYYLKVRSFNINGNVKIYGPWGDVKKVSVGNYYVDSDTQPQYSYHIYFLDKMGKELYTGCTRPVYIQTDNPNQNSILLRSNGKSVLSETIAVRSKSPYDDFDYISKEEWNEVLHKVEGGYIGYLDFDQSGVYNIELCEVQEKGRVVAEKFQWVVKDYDTALNDWMDQIIASNTNSSMTPFEKMEAVCEYLRTPGLFRYLTMSAGRVVTLAAEPNGPCFRTYRWDSATSPYMLCKFAERIGGFDDIHDCYGDYLGDYEEWKKTHHFAKLTIGTESRFFSVCPPGDTGDVGEIKKIDFTDTSSLYPVD